MIVITLTDGALKLARQIQDYMPVEIAHKPKPFKETVGQFFKSHDTLLFIMASGIVVRTIADFLEDKRKDPGILVMDEKGQFVISLLSGHIGGANEKAKQVAKLMGASPVITTASDVNHLLSIDMFAKKYDLILKDMEQAKILTAHLVNGHSIQIKGMQDIYEPGYTYEKADKLVEISHKKSVESDLQLIPKTLVLGIGCRKNISSQALMDFVCETLASNGYLLESVSMIASAWVKVKEKALLDLSQFLEIPFVVFNEKEILEACHPFEKSEFVLEQIGVPSVSLPCGYLASDGGHLLIDKIKRKGITLSLWEKKI